MVGDKDTSAGSKKGVSKDMLEAATDFVLAVIRGSARGCGMGLKALGEELEKFGDKSNGTSG